MNIIILVTANIDKYLIGARTDPSGGKNWYKYENNEKSPNLTKISMRKVELIHIYKIFLYI
jgi:hypothetical protein